ncbi:MAG: hypothetical protein ACRDQA_02180 [Nocardioidaceae bacterium]
MARQMIAYAKVRAEALRYREGNQWGASAIEWAIISAIVVGAAVILGKVIMDAVQSKSDEIQQKTG